MGTIRYEDYKYFRAPPVDSIILISVQTYQKSVLHGGNNQSENRTGQVTSPTEAPTTEPTRTQQTHQVTHSPSRRRPRRARGVAWRRQVLNRGGPIPIPKGLQFHSFD